MAADEVEPAGARSLIEPGFFTIPCPHDALLGPPHKSCMRYHGSTAAAAATSRRRMALASIPHFFWWCVRDGRERRFEGAARRTGRIAGPDQHWITLPGQ